VVAVGLVAFVIADSLLTNMITGTDAGSMLLRAVLRTVLAALILIGAVMGLGKKS
jgi:2-phosphoglycerate kinase